MTPRVGDSEPERPCRICRLEDELAVPTRSRGPPPNCCGPGCGASSDGADDEEESMVDAKPPCTDSFRDAIVLRRRDGEARRGRRGRRARAAFHRPIAAGEREQAEAIAASHRERGHAIVDEVAGHDVIDAGGLQQRLVNREEARHRNKLCAHSTTRSCLRVGRPIQAN